MESPNLPTPQEPEDNRLFRILISMLVLCGIAAMLSLGLIWAFQSPEWFSSPAETIVAENEQPPIEEPIIVSDSSRIENGIDVASGFVAEGDYLLVKGTCTACHSGKLVLQNRASREGWKEMIRWMQETQKLWDLGEAEDKILDYLATHYGPVENKGRRTHLVVEEWYEIE